ncbi:transposase family protein [Streptomyces californicus]|uniref:transposase family protein n=1 Tax=Streptomyces californicus TaxID=67351 RepID=UPI00378A253E
MNGTRPGLRPGRGSVLWARWRSTGWCSSTGSWPPLVQLRHATARDVLACWFGVDRSTITRAIGEVRPLLADRGCTVGPSVRLRTLAQVIDHLGADGKTEIIDGTEVHPGPPAGRRAQGPGSVHLR